MSRIETSRPATPWLSRLIGGNADWLVVAIGLAILYGPTVSELATGLWISDEQGHGPIVLAIAVWLISRQWSAVNAEPVPARGRGWAWGLLVLALVMYALGRSQSTLFLEVGSLLPALAAALLLLRGPGALRRLWFPLFFLLFLVPLPDSMVDAVTQPMKLSVSYVAEMLMRQAGYPVARTGVVLMVGPYQLLVADACAGLHTLFTLEALGLLYLNVVRHASALRNIGLAILIVPISFTANVIRVVVLCLITYHFGDAAGQGFLHGFAGMVLFLSALLLITSVDTLLRVLPIARKQAPA